MLNQLEQKACEEEPEMLWNAFLDRDRAMKLTRRIMEEGWISEKVYLQCIEEIKKKDGDENCDITMLHLSDRAYRCLRRTDITTVGQLRYILRGNEHPQNNREFFDIRNIGMRTALQICESAIQNNVIRQEEIGIDKQGTRNRLKWIRCKEEIGHNL